jgi:hypothetical protein
MAFGKKGKLEQPEAPEAADEGEPDAAEGLSETMFATPPPASAEEPPAEGGGGGDALGGDLLNMFQTTQLEAADLSVVLELAGDVEITDLMEELHTVAAALGITRDEEYEAA